MSYARLLLPSGLTTLAKLKKLGADARNQKRSPGAPNMATDVWDVAYDSAEPFRLVQLSDIAFDEIDATWSPEQRRTLDYDVRWFMRDEGWDDPGSAVSCHEPVRFHFECNWQDDLGRWHRSIHGVNAGRHRLIAAQRLDKQLVWAIVVESLFHPVGARPPDRRSLRTDDQKGVDHGHGV